MYVLVVIRCCRMCAAGIGDARRAMNRGAIRLGVLRSIVGVGHPHKRYRRRRFRDAIWREVVAVGGSQGVVVQLATEVGYRYTKMYCWPPCQNDNFASLIIECFTAVLDYGFVRGWRRQRLDSAQDSIILIQRSDARSVTMWLREMAAQALFTYAGGSSLDNGG